MVAVPTSSNDFYQFTLMKSEVWFCYGKQHSHMYLKLKVHHKWCFSLHLQTSIPSYETTGWDEIKIDEYFISSIDITFQFDGGISSMGINEVNVLALDPGMTECVSGPMSK